jgi:hypothetical protein
LLKGTDFYFLCYSDKKGTLKNRETNEGKQRKRITVTSSLNEKSKDQLGYRVVVRGRGEALLRACSLPTVSTIQQTSLEIFEDDVNG